MVETRHLIPFLPLTYSQQIGRVPEAIGLDTDLVQHPKIEIAKRSVVGITPMPGLAQSTAGLPEHENRQIVMVMTVSVGDPASIDDHRSI